MEANYPVSWQRQEKASVWVCAHAWGEQLHACTSLQGIAETRYTCLYIFTIVITLQNILLLINGHPTRHLSTSIPLHKETLLYKSITRHQSSWTYPQQLGPTMASYHTATMHWWIQHTHTPTLTHTSPTLVYWFQAHMQHWHSLRY